MEDNQYDCLSAEVILHLAQCISWKYHLPRFDPDRFLRAYNNPAEEGPYVLLGRNGVMWLDCYYLAYALTEGAPHYVYIARFHIIEELEALQEMGHGNHYLALGAVMQGYFREPYDYMRRHGTEIWIIPEYADDFAA